MECPRCQHETPSGAEFCPECGTKLTAVCPGCGAQSAPTHKFCPKCGSALSGVLGQTDDHQAARSSSDTERRQLTVMFCDLVGSTALAGTLDPEDMREVVRAFQEACAEAIHGYEGHIAQYLGDGLLVYFGYPRAHEDDAQRAVRAALGITDVMERLNTRLRREREARLAVRVGIHTGLVVMGEIGSGTRHEQLALGETPNLAARLQTIAEPDTVVISAATHRLIERWFACRDLGLHTAKGVSMPLQVYRVLNEKEAVPRGFETASTGLTALVGREQEVGLLLERWEQVKDGFGQVALLSGEAGIGKSRLLRELRERVANEPHIRWECRCSPYHQESSLYPVIELFQRALEFARDDRPEDKLRKIEDGLRRHGLSDPEAVALWSALLSVQLPAGSSPLNLTPQRQKQKTLEAVLGLLLALAAQQPMLFLIEDLHWVDPSTFELLNLVVEQAPTVRVLVLLTFRPDFRPPWAQRAHVAYLTLNRLTRRQTELMVGRAAGGKTLPMAVVQEVVAKTDGVPLFVEELTKMVLESGLLREQDAGFELMGPLPPLAIPATLQDSLMARLDRLATVKDVAQLGATLGRSFSYELLRAVSPVQEPALQHALRRLVDAELVYRRGAPPDAIYTFKHALIQEAAYHSLLKSRRQQFHQRIAQVLAERFPETAEVQPELLAHHCTEAGLVEEAIGYWQHAGQRAYERSANAESIAHLTRGLDVLQHLADGPKRLRRELDLQESLGLTLMTAKGYAAPEVQQTYSRALDLCRRVGNPPQLFAALWGLFWFHVLRAELQRGRELGEQLLSIAQSAGDQALLLRAHNAVGQNFFYSGDFSAARHHLEQAIAMYGSGRDRSDVFRYQVSHGVNCRAHAAWTLWCLGYAAEARVRSDEALALAQKESHPSSLAYALGFAAVIDQLCHEGEVAQARAEAMIALSREHRLSIWLAMATFRLGAALAEQGRLQEGVAKMRDGLAAWKSTGAELERPYRLSVLAKAYGQLGQTELALGLLAEALVAVSTSREGFWEAELHRLKGELLLAQSDKDQLAVEECFHQAIDVARRQQAKLLELRAVTSLSRLWQRQGKSERARRILGGVYGWFTEGFDTADLTDAKRLLDELSAS